MKKYLFALLVVGMSLVSFTTAETSTVEVESIEMAIYGESIDAFKCADCSYHWHEVATYPGSSPMPPNCPSCGVPFVKQQLLDVYTSPVNGITYYMWRCMSAVSGEGGGGSRVSDDHDETDPTQ